MRDMLRWPDWVVIILFFATFIWIGWVCAKKSKSAEGYFLAGRNLPGWLVGFSVMATIVSAMTFLALPGVSYAQDWRYIPWNLGYLLALIPAFFLFVPFFRRIHVSSPYEYLEYRYGTWARMYAALLFIIWMVCRMSIILYAVSLPIQTLSGLDLPLIILVFGVIATVYTVAGGLEAVIWTDLLQSIAMFVGAIICLPLIVLKLPGGLTQIVTEAYAEGKLSLGSTALTFDDKTIWVMIILSLFTWTHWGCQDQSMMQRYCAPKSDREAKKALWLGALLTIPVWTYFIFIGTALYVFYKNFPDPYLTEIADKPEQILPYFIMKNVPAGLAGLVICGLVAAAMSTMDSSINAVASTLTTDLYRRFRVKDRDEWHYLTMGRWFSCILGVVMIGGALIIHYKSDELLQDLQILVQSISGGGLLALTLLGMLTLRVGNRNAAIAVGVGLITVGLWLWLDSETGREWLAARGLSGWVPDKFWIHVLVNLLVVAIAYLLTIFLPSRRRQDLTNLTVWTTKQR